MANPFTFYKSPHTVSEHQSNANYWTYAKMDAIDKMQEWESAHPREVVPCEIQADVRTSRWVEKEYIRKAQQAREEQARQARQAGS
jgi:hypothetical protein